MLAVLLADDERPALESCAEALRLEGHHVVTAEDGLAALHALDKRDFDVAIVNVLLPRLSGVELFERARLRAPATRFIFLSAAPQVADAVSLMKRGALDYLVKPIALAELVVRLAELSAQCELIVRLDEAQSLPPSVDGLVGASTALARVHHLISRFGAARSTVLITGESGTGKELVAHALHRQSPNRDGPFVAINCAAFPESLLEAELFGHERGAFTGATQSRDGRFAAATGGTLFLDEVAEMPPSAQAKLLRVLQEGSYQRLGSNRTESSSARVIAASHRDLKQCITAGTFREDLYFRLRVLELPVPPLRARREDLMTLVAHFLKDDGRGPPRRITGRALAAIDQYGFPGNIRELKHAIHHACAVAGDGTVDLEHLPLELLAPVEQDPAGSQDLHEAMRGFEREFLKRTVERAGGKRIHAAKLLGISRKSLWEKLRAYGVSSELAHPIA